MANISLSQDVHVVPVLAPVDAVATAQVTKYVDLKQVGSGQVEFAINFGVVTSTDSTGDVTITIEADDVNDTTTSDTSAAAIAFQYRLSAAVGTDALGALTDATSAGYALINTDDGKSVLVYVDPAVAAKRYVRAIITPTAETTVCLVGVTARFVPRYAQATPKSSS